MIEFLSVYGENWSTWQPQVISAIWVTLGLTFFGYILALAIGLLVALGRMSNSAILRGFSKGYVEFTRGVPTLVILFLIYFGLPNFGIVFDAFWAGVIGLGIGMGGYIAEVFRSGLQAIHFGQREAALAVGMTPFQSFRYIMLPLAIRIVLPPMLNMLILILKDSSLCALITAPELMLMAKDLASTTFLPMHLYLLAGVIYLALSLPMSFVARRVEARMQAGMSR
ncbi:MAG: amino acid ABC transporter permease [Rhodobacteraceae bacterium]|nr:amino acid ABC transporter permease [Paracoccaceae bacterium]